MDSKVVIAVFDIGKTNKKLFLFDEDYRIVFERTAKFGETTDEDGDACENLDSLRKSVHDSLREVLADTRFHIKAINFATYGASFVYIDEHGKPLTPLYNYLKAYPEVLKVQFYSTYGGETQMSLATASPVLGSLNSGMQVYRIKYEKPAVFSKMSYALHLPQYLSLLITGRPCADITSIGCHTQLWDFTANRYHAWVEAEGLTQKLPEILPADGVLEASFDGKKVLAGIGLHDSSSALIPYLVNFSEPFALLSTGTWCITLNPFNDLPLTAEELTQDCLCYMSYKGKAVKASRLFSGHEHEQQTNLIARHFGQADAEYRQVLLDEQVFERLKSIPAPVHSHSESGLKTSLFNLRDLNDFATYDEAYHQLIMDLVQVQVGSSMLVLNGTPVKRIYVDGGFGKNALFMQLLASALPQYEVFAASVAQATAMGAALALHPHWNHKPVRTDIIELKHFAANPALAMS